MDDFFEEINTQINQVGGNQNERFTDIDDVFAKI